MHSLETKQKFVAFRAHGISLERIAQELQVAKCTLILWNQQFKDDIANLQSIHMEVLHEKVCPTYGTELARISRQLNQVEAVLAQRKLESLSTEYLFSLAGTLRSQLRRQRRLPAFVPTPSDAPAELDFSI